MRTSFLPFSREATFPPLAAAAAAACCQRAGAREKIGEESTGSPSHRLQRLDDVQKTYHFEDEPCHVFHTEAGRSSARSYRRRMCAIGNSSRRRGFSKTLKVSGRFLELESLPGTVRKPLAQGVGKGKCDHLVFSRVQNDEKLRERQSALVGVVGVLLKESFCFSIFFSASNLDPCDFPEGLIVEEPEATPPEAQGNSLGSFIEASQDFFSITDFDIGNLQSVGYPL